MNAPVFRAASKLLSFLDQDDGWIRFLEKKQIEPQREETHQRCDVFGPAPSHVRIQDDKATDERGKERTRENGHGEDGDGQTTRAVVKHVGEDGCHHSKGARAKRPAEESGDHDGLKILGYRGRDGKYRETEHGYDQRELSAFQLGQRSPQNWTSGKAENV